MSVCTGPCVCVTVCVCVCVCAGLGVCDSVCVYPIKYHYIHHYTPTHCGCSLCTPGLCQGPATLDGMQDTLGLENLHGKGAGVAVVLAAQSLEGQQDVHHKGNQREEPHQL